MRVERKWRVLLGVSTRKKPDPACEEWVDWRPGDIVDRFPPWCPVDEWEASGHIRPLEPEEVTDG